MIIFFLLQVEYQAINKPIADSLMELAVYFTIPKDELKFIIEDSVFYAQYETQLKVYNKKGNQLAGDYWAVKRREDSLAIKDSVKLIIPKISSSFHVRILDHNGGELLNISQKILIINYLGNIKWWLTNDTLNLNFSVFNQKGEADSILSSISGMKKGMGLRTGVYDDSLSFNISGLSNNDYPLNLEVFAARKKIDKLSIPIRIARPFFLDEATWALKVNQLMYIATPSEMNEIKDAPKTERDSLWRAFWKQYDPTPNTEYNEREAEYFVRIEYCDKYFSHGDRGWRSDRAKIYVKYGPPDEILSRPYEIQTRPYEVWYYYRDNRKFIFVDQHGFGEYLLMNTLGSTI